MFAPTCPCKKITSKLTQTRSIGQRDAVLRPKHWQSQWHPAPRSLAKSEQLIRHGGTASAFNLSKNAQPPHARWRKRLTHRTTEESPQRGAWTADLYSPGSRGAPRRIQRLFLATPQRPAFFKIRVNNRSADANNTGIPELRMPRCRVIEFNSPKSPGASLWKV